MNHSYDTCLKMDHTKQLMIINLLVTTPVSGVQWMRDWAREREAIRAPSVHCTKKTGVIHACKIASLRHSSHPYIKLFHRTPQGSTGLPYPQKLWGVPFPHVNATRVRLGGDNRGLGSRDWSTQARVMGRAEVTTTPSDQPAAARDQLRLN